MLINKSIERLVFFQIWNGYDYDENDGESIW